MAVRKNRLLKHPCKAVKAEAGKRVYRRKTEFFIAGHKIADPDSFGLYGISYRAAGQPEKKAHIIVNTVTESVRLLDNEIVESPAYGEDDIFLTR